MENVSDWMNENDANQDGRLSFKEFYRSLNEHLQLETEDDERRDDCLE